MLGVKKFIDKLKIRYIVNKVEKTNIPSFSDSTIIRKHILFYGKIQRVGFRMEASGIAKRLGLVGWIKNLSDGSVEAELQGTNQRITFLINHMKSLKRGRVTKVIENTIILQEELEFTIIK